MEDAKEVEEAQHMAIEALDKMAEIKIELKDETKELYERLLGIVHCKDCKWAGRDEHCPAIEVYMICGDNGYCSCGERDE